MTVQTMTRTGTHTISVLHGASGKTIPLDLSKLENYEGTIEGALRQAISKNVYPGFFDTLNSSVIDIELFSAGSEEEEAVERPLSRQTDWRDVLAELEKSDLELGVSRMRGEV